ncbi:rRNA-processing protein bfr2 [Rhizina undulata]
MTGIKAKGKKGTSLLGDLELLANPAPTDFDPEALEKECSDAGSGEEEDGSEDEVEDKNAGREHYVDVGKSKLRKENAVLLDPKYDGARVSRENLYDSDDEDDEGSEGSEDDDEDDEERDTSMGGVELNSDGELNLGGEIPTDEDDDIDSDDALGSDEEKFKDFKFRGSSTTANGVVPKRGDKVVGSSGESSGSEDDEEDEFNEEDEDEDEEEEEGDSENESQDEDEDEDEDDDEESESARRSELRKLMVEEQKSVLTNITKAAHADATKGKAARLQQSTFDALLSARIKLQKALTASNSLPPSPLTPNSSYESAEAVATSLFNTLTTIRTTLTESRGNPLKRKHDSITSSTPLFEIHDSLKSLESATHPWREQTLEKWSTKTQSIATVSLGRKLNNTAKQTLTGALHETLADDARLLKRTRVPRSAALGIPEESVEIFDDTDFYQLLLKALVDQRMVDLGAGAGAVRWTAAMKEAKGRKVVDTKASKGRKLRYHVHEKLLNFMAPAPCLEWEDGQIDELFSSLLGQRVRVTEEDSDEEMEIPDDGLRLFGS